MTHDEAVEVLRKNTLCDLNPVVPTILGIHPQVSYTMAARGDLPVVRFGKRIKLVCSAARKQWGID